MAYLRIAGHIVTVGAPDGSRRQTFGGALGQSAKAYAVDGRRERRREIRDATRCLSRPDADSVANLIVGRGHSWTFDSDLYASTGLGPTPGHTAHLAIDAGWNGGAVIVRSGGAIAFAAQLDDAWTVLVKIFDVDGLWHTYGITSDGRQWKDGVAGVYFGGTAPVVVAGGSAQLQAFTVAGAAADMTFDDLVVLPWLASPAVIASLSLDVEPPPPFPRVHVDGDAVEEPLGLICSGEVEDVSYVVRGDSGTRAPPYADAPLLDEAIDVAFALAGQDERTRYVQCPAPVSYWPLDSDSGTSTATAVDLSGSNSGTGSNVTGSTAGPSGALNTAVALSTAGAGGRYVVGDPANLEAHVGTSGQASWGFWVKPVSLAGRNLWVKDDVITGISAGLGEYRIRMTAAGALEVTLAEQGDFTLGTETYTSPAGVIVAGAWNWVAISYAASRGALVRIRAMVNRSPVRMSGVAAGAAFTQMNNTGFSAYFGAGGCSWAHSAYWSSALTVEQQRVAYLLTLRGHRILRS